MEETEKPRYPKHLDVGRIVIEETPEEKEEVTRHEVFKIDEVKPRHKDTEVRYEVERRPKQQKEDVVKVGRLDVTDYHKETMEFEPTKEKTTFIETIQKQRKVSHKTKYKLLGILRQNLFIKFNIRAILTTISLSIIVSKRLFRSEIMKT